jgi:hypothetical protein
VDKSFHLQDISGLRPNFIKVYTDSRSGPVN